MRFLAAVWSSLALTCPDLLPMWIDLGRAHELLQLGQLSWETALWTGSILVFITYYKSKTFCLSDIRLLATWISFWTKYIQMAHCAVPTFTAREQAGEARHAFCTRDFFKLSTIRFIVTRKIKRIQLYFLNKIDFIDPLCSACLHCQRASREAGRHASCAREDFSTYSSAA